MAGFRGRRDDQGTVDAVAALPCDFQRGLVRLDRLRDGRQTKRPDRAGFQNLLPGHRQLAQGDRHERVENLHADPAAAGEPGYSPSFTGNYLYGPNAAFGSTCRW